MNIYVSNLSFSLVEDDLRQIFSNYGEVSSVKVLRDRETGKSRGIGFVEMRRDNEATRAIEQLNGTDVMGRTITVKEANPRM
jgi:RNA recognition motif-containing protein